MISLLLERLWLSLGSGVEAALPTLWVSLTSQLILLTQAGITDIYRYFLLFFAQGQ